MRGYRLLKKSGQIDLISKVKQSLMDQQLRLTDKCFPAFLIGSRIPYDKIVNIKKASRNNQDGLFHPYQTGIVYRKTENWICVVAGNEAVVFESVADKMGNDLISEIKVGDRFHSHIAP